jgi:hypothetical protein
MGGAEGAGGADALTRGAPESGTQQEVAAPIPVCGAQQSCSPPAAAFAGGAAHGQTTAVAKPRLTSAATTARRERRTIASMGAPAVS